MYRSANSPSVGFEKNMLRFFENSENQFQFMTMTLFSWTANKRLL